MHSDVALGLAGQRVPSPLTRRSRLWEGSGPPTRQSRHHHDRRNGSSQGEREVVRLLDGDQVRMARQRLLQGVRWGLRAVFYPLLFLLAVWLLTRTSRTPPEFFSTSAQVIPILLLAAFFETGRTRDPDIFSPGLKVFMVGAFVGAETTCLLQLATGGSSYWAVALVALGLALGGLALLLPFLVGQLDAISGSASMREGSVARATKRAITIATRLLTLEGALAGAAALAIAVLVSTGIAGAGICVRGVGCLTSNPSGVEGTDHPTASLKLGEEPERSPVSP